MAMKPTDRIVAKPRGSIADVYAYCERRGRALDTFLVDYISEVFRLAPLVGIDPSEVIAQSDHECFNPVTGKPWDSYWWKLRGNPAGLGITGDPQQNEQSGKWNTGTDAARAQIAHMCGYVYGDDLLTHWPDTIQTPAFFDPRLPAIFEANLDGTVRTLNDLTGKWATDPRYAEKIAAKGNALFPGIPDQQEEPMPAIQFGNVPRPTIRDDLVIKPEGMGWGDYGPRQLRAVVLHRVVGAARYTSGHFRNLNDPHGRNALTDWGVCGALDGDMDGVILKWNDPDSRRSPWASGPASGLNGDAIAFMQRYAGPSGVGANVINRDTEAIELSGFYETPLTPKQLEAACQLIAYRIDTKMQLPWNVWPKNHDGIQAILWHGEVNGWSKPCPGKVVIDATNAIIARVGDILRHYQTAGVPVPPPQPDPEPEPIEKHALPKGMSEAMARRQFNPFKITHPDTGQRIVFDRGIAPCQVWLKWGKASMETDDWRSGSWPPLVSVIREGDGDETWKWASGPQYERKAA